MPTITLEMTKCAYLQSVRVYLGKLTRLDAVEKIVSQSRMNEGSAKDYVVGIAKMLNGELYKRTFNTEATDYILTKILAQFDLVVYEKALTSVEQHINYYESLRHGRLNSIRNVLEKHKASIKLYSDRLFPDELNESDNLMEGSKRSISVNVYERNAVARNKCIAHYGAICGICQFDFEAVYGEVGIGFIHVHHVVPLHTIGEFYVVDPIKDLLPVCPNCHAMLHREKTVLAVDALKEVINMKSCESM
ncbi:HNH endonuclease [Moritella viscosa]|uniref:HNH endonuclease n=1 Tax=Moritella viscosa TaxID=80854 RepID=UPI00091A748B|nr:HNH endonuclease [Moritella viscosa]SGY82728.1 HNH endonuclease [Moritella viscosa]